MRGRPRETRPSGPGTTSLARAWHHSGTAIRAAAGSGVKRTGFATDELRPAAEAVRHLAEPTAPADGGRASRNPGVRSRPMKTGVMPVGHLSESQVRSVLLAATAPPPLRNARPWR